MRIVLVLVVLALAGCGKKKAPQSPAAEAQMKQDAEEKNVNAPDDADDAQDMRSADPQEGGE